MSMKTLLAGLCLAAIGLGATATAEEDYVHLMSNDVEKITGEYVHIFTGDGTLVECMASKEV